VDVATQPNVVQHRHAAEDLHFLKCPGHAPRRPLVWFDIVDALAFEANFAFLGPVEAADAVHHDGFAGAVGADHGVNLSLANLKARPGQSRHFAEIHGNVLQLENDIALFDCGCSPHWFLLPSWMDASASRDRLRSSDAP